MKKVVLIITSKQEKTTLWKDREEYISEFCKIVEGQLTNTNVRYTTYDDLLFTIQAGKAAIVDTRYQLDLSEVHFVHFRNWAYEPEEAATIAMYLRSYSIPFFNTEVEAAGAADKLSQMFFLCKAGVPVPETFYARRVLLLHMMQSGKLPDGFQWPLIMKTINGSRGDDNHLVSSVEQANDILSSTDVEKQFIVQNFIENDGDYRFLFIGLETSPLVFHRKGANGSHLNNTSKGGTGTFVELSSLPALYLKHAFRAAEILNREISGVDIVVDKKTGKDYVLEVNNTPALATGYGLEAKAQKFAQFLEAYTEEIEEEE
jgi:glutathione synthase/RimK-type ligase-like ATP-grasp enzyme